MHVTERIENVVPTGQEPLAIVGMGCRLPGNVFDAESFWDFLADGRSGIVEVPPDRWTLDRFYHENAAVPGRMYTRWGGFVPNLEQFDARFWGITPREAMRMDPQQRWLLEVAWEAIEDSGTPPRAARQIGGRFRGDFHARLFGYPGPEFPGDRFAHEQRQYAEHRFEPHFVPAGPEGPQPVGGHRVFLLAGGPVDRLSQHLGGGMRRGARGWCQPDVRSSRHDWVQQGVDAFSRRPVFCL